MAVARFAIDVRGEDDASTSRAAYQLADAMIGVDGVEEAALTKTSADTMDLGSVVSILAASGATLAIAQGLADWLRARRGVTITLERTGGSQSIKAEVHGIDPATAERIIEKVKQA